MQEDPQFVVAVTYSPEALKDLIEGHGGDTIEAVCDELNSMLPTGSIEVRPLSEVIAC